MNVYRNSGGKRKNKSNKKRCLGLALEIQAKQVLTDLKVGDSVLTNGVCLTATSVGNDVFTADLMGRNAKQNIFFRA